MFRWDLHSYGSASGKKLKLTKNRNRYTIEINEEIKESFEEAGGEEFTYIPCLNDSKAHIDALSALIDKNLSGWIN